MEAKTGWMVGFLDWTVHLITAGGWAGAGMGAGAGAGTGVGAGAGAGGAGLAQANNNAPIIVIAGTTIAIFLKFIWLFPPYPFFLVFPSISDLKLPSRHDTQSSCP